MTITVTPIANNQTFGAWLSTTNRLANIISQNTVTSDSSSGGSLTTGNVYVNGHFGAGYLFAETALIGGNVSTNSTLNILANVNFTYSAANLTSITANSTASNLTIRTENTAIVGNTLFINATINAVSSANLGGSVFIANTLSVANAATFSDVINVENVIPLVSATFDLGSTTNLFKNTYTQTVLFATGSANGTQYTGTANNANNFNGQPASFYTNATNITTGTLATARLPATVNVTTLNASTVNTVNIVANGSTGTAGQVLSANGTGIYWASPAATGVTSVASGNGLSGGPITSTGTLVVAQGNGIVVNTSGVHVNSSFIAGSTANNSTNLGGQPASFYTNASNLSTGTVPTARLPVSNTTQSGIVQLVDSTSNTSTTHAATANSVRAVQAYAESIAAGVNPPGGVNTNIQFNNSGVLGGSAAFTFNNTTNTVTVGSQLSVGANASLSTDFLRLGNSTVNTAISAGSLTFNGVNVNTAITGNAATAYTNAITIAANATNITTGTLATARLPATVNVATEINVGSALKINTTAFGIGPNANGEVVLGTGFLSLIGNTGIQVVGGGGVSRIANVQINGNTVFVGNATINLVVSSSSLTISNSGSNAVVNTTGFYVNNQLVGSNASLITTGTLANTRLPSIVGFSSANVTSEVRVGTVLRLGDGSTFVNTTSIYVSNGSGESILQPGLLTTGQISLGAGGLTINPVDSTVSRVLANNTTVSVGNSTINTHYSNATLLISNSTSTTILNLTNLRIGNTTTNVVIANTTSMFGGNVAISGTLSGNVDISGSYRSNIVAVPALDINCSTGNYFTKTINATSTFTFSNVPSSRAYSFTLELTHTSGSITWPTAVRWPSNTAPTLTTGRTHLFMFVTDDGGTRWRGSALANYDN